MWSLAFIPRVLFSRAIRIISHVTLVTNRIKDTHVFICICIYISFNDAFNNADYIASNDRMFTE
jgi:hypothetical protein